MTQKNVSLMDFNGNSNIGIYMFANDKFCLLGPKISESKQKEIEKTLGVPVYNVNILNTDLLGVFVAGNNDFLVIPEVFSKEFTQIKEVCDKHSVKLIQIPEIKNTFGNNICVGDEEILINYDLSKSCKNRLLEDTDCDIFEIKAKKFEAIGSTAIYLNGKYFFSQEYNENEVKNIVDKISAVGTINQGSNYISSGVVGNKTGVIIGVQSSTVEIQNIVESLDYI